MFNWNRKEKPLQGLMGVGGGATGLLYSGGGGGGGFILENLPSAYQTLYNNSISAGYTCLLYTSPSPRD